MGKKKTSTKGGKTPKPDKAKKKNENSKNNTKISTGVSWQLGQLCTSALLLWKTTKHPHQQTYPWGRGAGGSLGGGGGGGGGGGVCCGGGDGGAGRWGAGERVGSETFPKS